MKKGHFFVKLPYLCLFAGALGAATLQVGPASAYKTPCAAIAAAAPGDTILIEGGNYNGDVCSWSQPGLTLRGVNGRPHIDAAGKNAAGKGTWVIDGDNTVVENIEFSGATVPDANGAGIRLEVPNLTVRNCYFHNNQNGILTGNGGTGEVLVEYSEFAHNGTGSGNTHNIYIGRQGKFTLRFSYSHDANTGHLVKSRAAENYILYNRLSTETGTTSYEIDLPNGGLSFVMGNLIVQGVNGTNNNMLAFMKEGIDPHNPDHRLFVINNTFVNAKSNGTFLNISSVDDTPVVAQNNIFNGVGEISTQDSTVLTHNMTGGNPMFVNPGAYDYHLQNGSPAISAGLALSAIGEQSLIPVYQYVHPTCGEVRTLVGSIDAGAFEFGGAGTPLSCAPSTAPPALDSLSVSPANVRGGAMAMATALLDNPAPAGGILVSVSSTDGSVASAASTLTVAPGSLGVSFPVTTGAVPSVTTVMVTASYAGVSKAAAITVNPPPTVAAVQMQGITASTATIVWTSSVASTSQVSYGKTTSYGSLSAIDGNRVLVHSIKLTGLAAATTYHFRTLSTDALGGQAASGDNTFTTLASDPGQYTVSVSPSAVNAFDVVNVSWSAPPNRYVTDWVVIVPVGAPSNQYATSFTLSWSTSGTSAVIAPATPGQYEARLLLPDSYIEVARSKPFTVNPPTGYSLIAPASGKVKGSIVVNWKAPANRPKTDMVGLFSEDGVAYWYKSTQGAASGNFTASGPPVAGLYEFRYITGNSITVAKSAIITVK